MSKEKSPGRSSPRYLDPPELRVYGTEPGDVRTVVVSFRPRSVKYACFLQPERGTFLDVGVDGKERPVALILQEELEGGRLLRTVEALGRGLPRKDGSRRFDKTTSALLLRGLFRGLDEFREVTVPPEARFPG